MLVLFVVFLPHEAVIAAFTPLAVFWIVILALAPWKMDPEERSDRARRARSGLRLTTCRRKACVKTPRPAGRALAAKVEHAGDDE